MKDTKLEKEIRFVTVFKNVTKERFWKALQTRLAPQITQVTLQAILAGTPTSRKWHIPEHVAHIYRVCLTSAQRLY